MSGAGKAMLRRPGGELIRVVELPPVVKRPDDEPQD